MNLDSFEIFFLFFNVQKQIIMNRLKFLVAISFLLSMVCLQSCQKNSNDEILQSKNIIVDDLNEEDLNNIHDRLKKELNHNISFITLSERGVFYKNSEESNIIPTHIRKIADVSGAGDTVIAVASLVYASTKNVKLMAEVSNIAGGLVCEEVGTVAINKEKLIEECDLLL